MLICCRCASDGFPGRPERSQSTEREQTTGTEGPRSITPNCSLPALPTRPNEAQATGTKARDDEVQKDTLSAFILLTLDRSRVSEVELRLVVVSNLSFAPQRHMAQNRPPQPNFGQAAGPAGATGPQRPPPPGATAANGQQPRPQQQPPMQGYQQQQQQQQRPPPAGMPGAGPGQGQGQPGFPQGGECAIPCSGIVDCRA